MAKYIKSEETGEIIKDLDKKSPKYKGGKAIKATRRTASGGTLDMYGEEDEGIRYNKGKAIESPTKTPARYEHITWQDYHGSAYPSEGRATARDRRMSKHREAGEMELDDRMVTTKRKEPKVQVQKRKYHHNTYTEGE